LIEINMKYFLTSPRYMYLEIRRANSPPPPSHQPTKEDAAYVVLRVHTSK
jgi:hypothetical protein